MRLDRYLVEKGLVRSRERAKELIAQGLVRADGQVRSKPSFDVPEGVEVTVEAAAYDYVGRGLLKLEEALRVFEIDPSGKVCADIGASTGGFTQSLLRHGAIRVYAVDVGHGQLAEELRDDPRVVNMEGINARTLTPESFGERPDLMSVDLSFISLSAVMPALAGCLKGDSELIVLIKPQFEAGRSSLNKHGIIRSKKDHVAVLKKTFDMFAACGLSVLGAAPSPVKGGSGNIEYLAYLKPSELPGINADAAALAAKAFELFRTCAGAEEG